MRLKNISVGNDEIAFNRKYNFFHNVRFENNTSILSSIFLLKSILLTMYSKFDAILKLVNQDFKVKSRKRIIIVKEIKQLFLINSFDVDMNSLLSIQNIFFI
jgi:hypothetical protein